MTRMRMKKYVIIDEINGQKCAEIEAAHEKSALTKFWKGKLTPGLYSIEEKKDGRPRLLSSYGSSFRADPC